VSGILCAIRGGVECRSTIHKAVSLARERDLPVHFLYVLTPRLTPPIDGSRAEALSELFREMGESVLAAAQSTALASGVQAYVSVRRGNVGEEIIESCGDLSADYLVIGSPRRRSGRNAFKPASLEQLKARVEEEVGARVLLS
jgi:nucleotide-binding universal stress UspA family protein